jgi:maleamate amidohydrolase
MGIGFEDHSWKDIVDQKTLDIYQPYQRKTYVGKNPALLAIDLYNMAYEGGPKPVHEIVNEFPNSCGMNAWNAIEPTKELFSITRSLDMPVIYSTRRSNKITSTFRQKYNKIDENSYEIKEEFSPHSDDLIVYKERASVFFGTPLIAYLTKLGVDSLIVCGESMSGCVRASVVDAYSYGFHTVVVEECCFDRSDLPYKMNLFDLHHKYADVMHLDELKEHLLK